MKIREARIAACAFSAAIDIARAFFDRADEPNLHVAGAAVVRRRRSYVVIPDHTDHARRHEALHLGWCDHHSLAPSTFEGVLTVRPASGRVELILEGDVLSEADASRLLLAIAHHIEGEWRSFVARTPSIDACNQRASHMLHV